MAVAGQDQDLDLHFGKWLEETAKHFVSLDDVEKNRTLTQIIELCGPVQLQFLSDHLEGLLKRDFVKHLPREISFHVVKWLDCATLCRCCLVSKEWRKVISSCNKAWFKACKEIGMMGNVVSDEHIPSAVNWKLKYASARKRLKKLQMENTFGSRQLVGHTARVFALHYKDGLLATGSDDRTVRLWNPTSGHCEYTLSCHSCADIKFDNEKVLTASFDNTLSLWEWSSGCCIRKYCGHVGAVFCVDYEEEIDLIVSGSSDCTVKLWQMSTGSCLTTRSGHKDWVTSVLLQKVDQTIQDILNEEYLIITMDKTLIKIWSTDASIDKCITTLSCIAGEQNLQPRLLCNGQEIMCSSANGLCIWDLVTFQLTRLFTTFHNLWLVAHGTIFSILLDVNYLYVLNNATEQCIVKIPMLGMRKSLRGSNFVALDSSWLDDCDTNLTCGLVFAASRTDYTINVVRWNN